MSSNWSMIRVKELLEEVDLVNHFSSLREMYSRNCLGMNWW